MDAEIGGIPYQKTLAKNPGGVLQLDGFPINDINYIHRLLKGELTMATTAKKSVIAKSVKAVATKRIPPKVATTPVAPVVAPKVAVKVKKPKLVRDSFTIPKGEYTVLDDLKQRAGKLTSPVRKSELIRAGVKALAAMTDMAFLAALKAVPAIKTGRPAKAKAN